MCDFLVCIGQLPSSNHIILQVQNLLIPPRVVEFSYFLFNRVGDFRQVSSIFRIKISFLVLVWFLVNKGFSKNYFLFDRDYGRAFAIVSLDKCVCTTSDIWSAKSRNVACDWKRQEFRRESNSSEKHTYYKIENINVKYNLDSRKFIATIADNSSNF